MLASPLPPFNDSPRNRRAKHPPLLLRKEVGRGGFFVPFRFTGRRGKGSLFDGVRSSMLESLRETLSLRASLENPNSHGMLILVQKTIVCCNQFNFAMCPRKKVRCFSPSPPLEERVGEGRPITVTLSQPAS